MSQKKNREPAGKNVTPLNEYWRIATALRFRGKGRRLAVMTSLRKRCELFLGDQTSEVLYSTHQLRHITHFVIVPGYGLNQLLIAYG